jgi:NAD(P)-dependent dehydrogenase (short-subunit alcohol dehydrogenase family)
MSTAVGQIALVTGASSGFGLLTSIELARRGSRVFATMRDLNKAERLDSAAHAAGVAVEKLALDVARAASVRAAVDEALARAGRIDVLVNNAGFGMGGALEELDDAELREQFETNFFGVVAMTKAVLPGMRERRQGRIINVSSIGGLVASPGMSAYCASKFAVEGLSESLRYEVAPFGVSVILVEPGTFKTDIFGPNRRVAKRARDPQSPYYAMNKQMSAFVQKMVARSTADPMDVARTIAHAATTPRPRLRYLVGRDARAQKIAKTILPSSVIELAMARVMRS